MVIRSPGLLVNYNQFNTGSEFVLGIVFSTQNPMIKRLFDICHAGIRTIFMWVCYRKTTLRIVSWSVLTTRLRIWYSYKKENEKHRSNKHTFCLLCMICVLLYTGHDVLWTYTCIYSYVGYCDKKKCVLIYIEHLRLNFSSRFYSR